MTMIFFLVIFLANIKTGNVHNLHNKDQIGNFGIKSFLNVSFVNDLPEELKDGNVDLSSKDVAGVTKSDEEQPKTKYGLRYEDVVLYKTMLIDFEEINDLISELPKPCLICDVNMSLSPVIVIAYLIGKNKMDVNRASFMIMGKTGSTDVNKNVYGQVLSYRPGQKIIKV